MDRSRTRAGRAVGAIGLIALLVSVAACGGSASQTVLSTVGNAVDPEPATGGQRTDGEGTDTGGQPGGNANGYGGNGNANGAFRDLARIVYNGTLSVQVKDLDAAVRAGRSAVLGAGGYVGGSRRSTDGQYATATITYRIPAESWEESLDALRSLGTVLGEEIEATEVTGQIVDLQARIRNLRVSEAAIQEIAKKATTFDDILEGQARLSDVRGQIEQLDAQLASLEDRADLGTLDVTYGREQAAVIAATEDAKWDAGADVARATDSLVSVLQALASIGIWLVIFGLPVMAIVLLVALLTRFVLRRTRVLDRVDPGIAGPTVPGGTA